MRGGEEEEEEEEEAMSMRKSPWEILSCYISIHWGPAGRRRGRSGRGWTWGSRATFFLLFFFFFFSFPLSCHVMTIHEPEPEPRAAKTILLNPFQRPTPPLFLKGHLYAQRAIAALLKVRYLVMPHHITKRSMRSR